MSAIYSFPSNTPFRIIQNLTHLPYNHILKRLNSTKRKMHREYSQTPERGSSNGRRVGGRTWDLNEEDGDDCVNVF